MRISYFLLGALMAIPSMQAQTNTFTTPTDNGRLVTVEVVTDDIIRVANTLPGETIPATGLLTEVSAPFKGKTMTTSAGLVITTPTGVTVNVSSRDGAVSIMAGANRAVSDPGLRLLQNGKRRIELSTMGTGSFYGAGERGHAFNLAGDTLTVYNRQNYGYTKGDPRISQMNITMPLFVSSNGYAVLFDDFAASQIVMSNPIEYTTESPAPVAWYFINGAGSLDGATRRLSQLTGRQPLPPLWSLGYITSKYGYRTQAGTLGVVDTLKRKGYPVDGIVLDLYWYGKEQDMGRLAWDPQQWPNHKKMLADLKRMA